MITLSAAAGWLAKVHLVSERQQCKILDLLQCVHVVFGLFVYFPLQNYYCRACLGCHGPDYGDEVMCEQ